MDCIRRLKDEPGVYTVQNKSKEWITSSECLARELDKPRSRATVAEIEGAVMYSPTLVRRVLKGTLEQLEADGVLQLCTMEVGPVNEESWTKQLHEHHADWEKRTMRTLSNMWIMSTEAS